MPTGIPRLGQAAIEDHNSKKLEDAFPGGEVLGEIKAKGPAVTAWDEPDFGVQIQLEQGPPPWETAGDHQPSDARNFLECPDEWVLRWINPKLLAQEGWRGWSPVRARDPRVKVKVPSMVSPEYQIRRGGHGGDILAYMPRHWFESNRTKYYIDVARRTQASVDKAMGLREQVRNIHPGITVESVTHPTHTIGAIDRDAP